MDGDIELVNKIDKSIGEKAFVINVAAKVLSEEVHKMNDELQLDGIALKPIDVNRSKILIFEDQVFSQITLENILFD